MDDVKYLDVRTFGYALIDPEAAIPEKTMERIESLLAFKPVLECCPGGQYLGFDNRHNSPVNRSDIVEVLRALAPITIAGNFVVSSDENSDYHKWEFKNGIWHEYERVWKAVHRSQRIEIPLSDGNRLVAEENPDPSGYKEIFIGLENNERGWFQDLAMVGEQYSYAPSLRKVPKPGNYRVLVYGDENSEDYTEEIPIRLHQEEEA